MEAMRVAASRLAASCEEPPIPVPHETALAGMALGCKKCGNDVVALVAGAAVVLHAAGALIVEPRGGDHVSIAENGCALRLAIPRVRAHSFVDTPMGGTMMSLAGALVPSLFMRSTGMRGFGTATKRAKKGRGA